MNLARGFAFVSRVSVPLVLGVACSSASTGLFSETTNGSNTAGSGSPSAGTSANVAGGPTESTAGALGVGGLFAEAGDGSGGGSSAGAVSSSGGAVGSSGASTGSSGSGHGGFAGASMGGSATGGSGSAGESAGSGGVSVAGTAGTAVGGSGTSGGPANMGGGSGSGGNAGAGCPANAPVQGNVCTVSTPDSCFYSGIACSCMASGLIQASQATKKWACYGTPDKCPEAVPVSTASCKSSGGGATCPYPGNANFCACIGNGNDPKWTCQMPSASCPGIKPINGTLCGPVRACSYADNACFCNGTTWGCESG